MRSSTLIGLASIAILAASLALANRDDVTFRLVPFVPDDSVFVLVTPLYLLVFFTFLIGVVIGAATVGLRWRRNARQRRLAARDVEKRLALDAARARME
ncbi:MAG TPA: lipopolysaccharide assembly protein LapA domain-containing protein [Micropepsaceae bacterium]|jgi:uncharacterized integral membrane protein|nr:lipopolysaccharide assembly protein LapA domain-containing protein [Micropepsaceae bacterium]